MVENGPPQHIDTHVHNIHMGILKVLRLYVLSWRRTFVVAKNDLAEISLFRTVIGL